MPFQHILHKLEDQEYLSKQCNFCKKNMILTEGSIIFESDWYHQNYFSSIDFTYHKLVSVKNNHTTQSRNGVIKDNA